MITSRQPSLFGEDGKMSSPISPEQLDERNAIDLLALAEVPGIGFGSIRALLSAYAFDLSRVWEQNEEQLAVDLRRVRAPQPAESARQIMRRSGRLHEIATDRYRFLQSAHTSIIFKSSKNYPTRLLDLAQPPAWLFVQGDVSLLHHPAVVAVVGTRRPTADGLAAAKRASAVIATSGCVILSGLAEGIDAVGHKTAVDFGVPTIAVLGHGTDVVFPASTADLRRELVERGGAVVSEYLPRDSYLAERFVQRNRIQAALSGAVGVVEGQSRSGTAHTVRFARKAARPLFGVHLGELLGAVQQDLLRDLAVEGDPVFDLENSDGRNQLRAFLGQVFGESSQVQQRPRIFNGLIDTVARVARDYDATEEDFNYLVEQIRQIQGGRTDASQGGNPRS